MQITVDIPDKLAKKFNKKFKPTQRKKIIEEFIENKINGSKKYKEDTFIKWLMKPVKRIDKDKVNNVSENHDDYIYT